MAIVGNDNRRPPLTKQLMRDDMTDDVLPLDDEELIAQASDTGLDAVVVLPARDEEGRIGDALRALAAQTVGPGMFRTIVVLDGCHDRTIEVVDAVSRAAGLLVRTIDGPGTGAGAARRAGMDHACELLLAAGRPDGLIACTDPDSRPAADWLERQLAHVAAGARAIAGLIEVAEPEAAHHHFAGASLGVTAATYRAVGGLEPLAALEDAGFAARLAAHHVPILRASDVRVATSPRTDGRVGRGLSIDLAVSGWLERRRFGASEFGPERLRAVAGRPSVAVVIPAKECAATIRGVVEGTVGPLRAAGVVDEVVVVDARSADRTAELAAGAGARVIQQDEIRAELGPALGKGDAMWRALQATSSEIVCFLDGDTVDPAPDHLQGLLGPLLCDPTVHLVKGSFDRPLRAGAVSLPHEGGRVTELMARPLINLHEPLLAGFSQPLAGEFAGRRDLFEAIPFPVGYGVEIAVLIDALRLVGLDAMAECHLGSRQNRHQPLRALGEMAYAVLAAVEARLDGRRSGAPPMAAGGYVKPWDSGATASIPTLERPPIREARAPAARAPAS